MNTEIINTAQKITDIGAFYYILAFVSITFLSLLGIVFKVMYDNNRRAEKQNKLFEDIFVNTLKEIPKSLEKFQIELLKEFEKFNSQQTNAWQGVNEAIQGLYNVVLNDKMLDKKTIRKIIKLSINNTLFVLYMEIEDILNRNNIISNIDSILNNIDTVMDSEVQKGREFLTGFFSKEKKYLKLLFLETEKIKQKVKQDIKDAFIETVENLKEIETYLESNTSVSCEHHKVLEQRKQKYYIDLRQKIKYLFEKTKNNIENILEGERYE
jgi:hypothetical protein